MSAFQRYVLPAVSLHLALILPATVSAGTPDGPYWTEWALPPAMVGGVKALGTTIVVEEVAAVNIWSGITRQWIQVPTSGNHFVSSFNAYVIIEDGTTLHGFASRTGTVDTLVLPAAPSLTHGPSSSSWVSIAELGSDVYGFGAFDGRWVKQTLGAPPATILATSVVAVVHDGAAAYGFNAYDGAWAAIAAPGAPFLDADGMLAVANDPTLARCYSAHTGAWTTQAIPAAATTTVTRGYALFQDGADLIAVSALTGTAAQTTLAAPPSQALANRHTAAFVAGDEVTCYSAATATFTTKSFNAPSVQVAENLAVVSDAAGVTGFSTPAGAFSPELPGSYTVQLSATDVAFAAGATADYGYSLLENDWFVAPANGWPVELFGNGVVILDSSPTASAFHGFSGRTGQWLTRPADTPLGYAVHTAGDIFVAQEGSNLYAFDPRIGRWAELAAAAPVSPALFRTVAITYDGVSGHGFGLMNNVWDSIVVQGSPVQITASSASGYIQTATHLYTYTAHGSFSTTSRFPEFTRFQPQTDALPLIQVGPAGAAVLTLIGTGATYLPTAAKGTLFVDPAGLSIAPLGVIPAGGLLRLDVTIPPAPALHGFAIHMQNAILPPAGSAWLTNSIAPVIL